MAMTPSQTVVQSLSILGKRKASQRTESLVLHVSSDPGSSYEESDWERPKPSSSKASIMMVNGALVQNPNKPYQCTFEGCDKAYTKPSRLEEHERSHTGLRPFICGTCQKSFLRESHLHAHARSHLPESERPFICEVDGCIKRFWTSQHLQAHKKLHTGEKPFKCSEPGCEEAFAKNYQLRAHSCSVHAPPGTKPYQCTHGGCFKSFATNQKLRAHLKVHDDKRYTCVHPSCLLTPDSITTYFSTWTALQHHMRVAHPPTCTHPSCNGKTFTSHKGLRAHQKLHEERDAEARLDYMANGSDAEDSDGEQRPRKKRRGGELGRDWKCDVEGCDKDFKSKKAMNTHVHIYHLGHRDFVCPRASCKRAFGYKHLLQRHLAKAHKPSTGAASSDSEGNADVTDTDARESEAMFGIDEITGSGYAKRAAERMRTAQALRCPHPHLGDMITLPTTGDEGSTFQPICDYVFSRAYDLRRHLKTEHNTLVGKDVVDKWVRTRKSNVDKL